MKKAFLAIFVMMVGISFAQEEKADWGTDSLKCRQNVALYSDFLSKKDYKGATRFWQEVLGYCPKYKPLLYTNGAFIYKKLADEETDEAKKKIYIDTVFFAYERLLEYFGPNATAKEDYGIALMKYDAKNSYEKANQLLKDAIEGLPGKVSPTALQYYYMSNLQMYKAKKIDENTMVDEYFKSIDASQLAYKATKSENYPKVEDYLTKVAEPFLSCEQIVPFNQKKFEEKPDDVDNLKKILSSLDKAKCTDSDLFGQVTEKLLKLEPSAEGYYNYAILMEKKNKDAESMSNIAKAIELCNGCDDKEKYISTAAKLASKAGRGQQAVAYANDWLSINPNSGEAYLIIAKAYASSASTCATNNAEKGIVYCLAVDYAAKAKSVDASVANAANSAIGTWSGYFPTKEECFFQNINAGSSYTVGCWINKSTTVRTKD
jgi:hypothetical protein